MMYPEGTRRSTFELRRARYFESREEDPRNQRNADIKGHRNHKMPDNPRRTSS